MTGQTATILSKNYDGTLRKSWKCRLVHQDGPELLFVGEFEKDVSHSELGFIKRGTISYEYYWLDRWFNVFRFHEPTGGLRNYYCNVNMPPTFVGGILEYVDLDLDLLVWPDFNYTVLDREEFESNAELYGYSASVRSHAKSALAELISMAESRTLPRLI
ncbi:MAG: DUF402 domain-containing protein [Acidobacteriota bacterium]